MILRKKALVILMVMALMVFGASCIYGAEGDTGNDSSQEANYKTGIVKLESILKIHPDTQDLYLEYQDKLNQIETSLEEENDKEVAIKNLKQKYTALLRDKIQSDLDKFTSIQELDVLFIDNIAVSGNTDLNLEDVTNITDITQYLETYFAKSNSTTVDTTEEN